MTGSSSAEVAEIGGAWGPPPPPPRPPHLVVRAPADERRREEGDRNPQTRPAPPQCQRSHAPCKGQPRQHSPKETVGRIGPDRQNQKIENEGDADRRAARDKGEAVQHDPEHSGG